MLVLGQIWIKVVLLTLHKIGIAFNKKTHKAKKNWRQERKGFCNNKKGVVIFLDI